MFPCRRSAVALMTLLALPAKGQALLNPVFQDHAVLQRDQPIRLWGTTAPGATLTLRLGDRSGMATADSSGQWRIELPAMTAGGPYSVTVKTSTGTTQTLSDVLIGDVYLCSGQSNMAFAVSRAIDVGPDIQTSANDAIRLMNVAAAGYPTPKAMLPNAITWATADPKTVPGFSAACYFFGRSLHKSVHVPLGLINASQPGANITSFMSADALAGVGGRGDLLEILSIYARDPVAGIKHMSGVVEAFWRSRGKALWVDPAASASWPEAPQSLGVWSEWGVAELEHFGAGMWLRTSVSLTATQAALGGTLSLGTITDEDTTWVNGHVIGTTVAYAQDRVYALPAGVLHKGANDILVEVHCGGRGCGLFGTPQARMIRFTSGSQIPLNGPWRYMIETTTPPRAPWDVASGVCSAFNGMIAPLARYGLKGVLWYQGESNADEPNAYRGLLKALMGDWRGSFQSPKLPFLIVQLPAYGLPSFAPEKSNWAALRESQRLAVADDANTALAVTIDIGDHMGLHPSNKQEVGRRLALAAQRLIYGDASVLPGPQPIRAKVKSNVVTITFTGFNGKLAAAGARRPIGFELCETRCRYVGATITDNAVQLAVPKGLKPTRVRYCWGDGPVCTLYDTTHLPAVPFEMALDTSHH